MIVTIIAGIITGFVVSVPPLGPIAFALISKGFRGEKKEGMAIAAGSAFMDMVYALIAFGGISLFISFLPSSAEEFIKNNSYTIQIVLIYAGCAAVVYYGIKIMRSKDDFEKLEAKESQHLSAAQGRAAGFVKKHKMPIPDKSNFFGLFVMGVMLCISSITLPASWVLLVGYVKGFGVIDQSFWGGLLFSVGAFIGTILWFWLLLKAITVFKHKINRHTIGKLNIIAGIILLILGVFLFVKATGTLFNIF
ncbi:MAG: LysE family transporter [Ignavibacteria bacterium]|nr:LysE family transporter [Ignavibacteria bacterium]